MKDWNIKAANFYNQIMNQACILLGLVAEDATEAEVHQGLVDAGTLDAVRSQAVADMEAKMKGFEDSLSALTAEVETMKGQIAEKDKAISALEAAAAEATEATAKTIAEKDGLIKSLSGEVAGLKAAKPIEKDTPLDPNLSLPKESGNHAGNARSISSEDLAKAFAKN